MTKQEQLIIILLVLAALLGTGLLYFHRFHETQVFPKVVEVKEQGGSKEVVVDVKGACWQPGVYTLPYGARVKDLMERALPREDANLDSINLARRLKDGEGIFIPTRSNGASANDAPLARTSNGGHSEKVNINIANIEELEKLPQIGPKIAGYIVNYRNTHGPFKNIEEIKKVEKIGEETFKRIKDLITVE
jgi:competence protein ComEA